MTTIQSHIVIPIHMCSHEQRTGQTKDCLLFDLSRKYGSFLTCSLRLSSRKFIAVIINIIIIIFYDSSPNDLFVTLEELFLKCLHHLGASVRKQATKSHDHLL